MRGPSHLDPKSEPWQQISQLYCLQRIAVGDRQKFCESEYASVVVDGVTY